MARQRSARRRRRELAGDLRARGHSWVAIGAALRREWPELTVLASIRMAHGWTQLEVANQWMLRWPDETRAAKDIGLWENWPAGSGRRPSFEMLDKLAQVYECSVSDLLADVSDHRHLDSACTPEPAAAEALSVLPERSASNQAPGARWGDTGAAGWVIGGEGLDGESAVVEGFGQVLSLVEERARRFSQLVGTGNTSGELIEQVRDDVAQVASAYQRRPLTVLLGELSTVQGTVFDLLEGRQRPGDARELYFLGGVVSGLLAKACHDLAQLSGAMVHTRTALLCAEQADHEGLGAWVRGLQSQIAYWAGRPRDALRFAQAGAALASGGTGSTSVWLPASEARAWAALGDPAEAVAAIERTEDALNYLDGDELDAIGGLCHFSAARQRYYAADALAWLPGESARAERYATQAVDAYADVDAEDWAFGDQAGSYACLAIAWINNGERDGAREALAPVLSLAPELRINGVVGSAQRVYRTLLGSQLAASSRDLQDEIEAFTSTPLAALPPGA